MLYESGAARNDANASEGKRSRQSPRARGLIMLLATVKSDRQIHQEVLRELRRDARVDETEVGVHAPVVRDVKDKLTVSPWD
jgi:heme exporter protein D